MWDMEKVALAKRMYYYNKVSEEILYKTALGDSIEQIIIDDLLERTCVFFHREGFLIHPGDVVVESQHDAFNRTYNVRATWSPSTQVVQLHIPEDQERHGRMIALNGAPDIPLKTYSRQGNIFDTPIVEETWKCIGWNPADRTWAYARVDQRKMIC